MLGRRNPYTVVTGLDPVLPKRLVQRHPVAAITPNEYVANPMQYLDEAYEDVCR